MTKQQKHMKRRLLAAMLVCALVSAFCLATIVYADTAETEAPVVTEAPTTDAPTTEPTTDDPSVYQSVENKEDSGVWTAINGFFGKILNFCNKITGNYIIALFVFSLIMQIALCFVGIKQQKNSIGQAKLAPKVAAINKKYAGRNDQATLQKKQQETMDLYQKEGYSPMGGCLPLLIQFPIILILYNVVVAPIQYILNLSGTVASNLQYMLTAYGVEGFASNNRAIQMNVINWFRQNGAEGVSALRTWIETIVSPANAEAATRYGEALNAIEGKMNVLPNFMIGPVDLAQTPSFTGNGSDLGKWLLLLVPVLTFVFLMLTQYLTKKFTYQSPESVEAQNKLSMKIMMWSMPLLSVYFTFIVPAAIGVYWIFRNILNLVQQMILAKVMPIPKYSEEEYKAAERELMGSSQRKKEKAPRDPNKPKVRSLHHIDDEGYDNGYKIDPDAPAEEEKPVGETTDASNAPAPIKNDDKTSYTAR